MKNLCQKTESFVQNLLNIKPATKPTITIKVIPEMELISITTWKESCHNITFIYLQSLKGFSIKSREKPIGYEAIVQSTR